MKADREEIGKLIGEARKSGASQKKACEQIGLCVKTFQRWLKNPDSKDGRLVGGRIPHNKLTELERMRILELANQPLYTELSPAKIAIKLMDTGVYVASESSFYRVLKEEKQLLHRQRSLPVRQVTKPLALKANSANQIYSWDITYLPTRVKGVFLYLYLVMDIYSRKIVGWQVYETESAAQAADLMKDICKRESIERHQVTLHSDNGSPMKGATMLATLQQLGVVPSFSRPAVSNDNPYSESLFRTLKYRPEYPESPFIDLEAARDWVQGFVGWYNNEHMHSAIQFVTPAQRHAGLDAAILKKRKKIVEEAKTRHPNRWSGSTRNWEPIKNVYLNPEKEKVSVERNKAA